MPDTYAARIFSAKEIEIVRALPEHLKPLLCKGSSLVCGDSWGCAIRALFCPVQFLKIHQNPVFPVFTSLDRASLLFAVCHPLGVSCAAAFHLHSKHFTK